MDRGFRFPFLLPLFPTSCLLLHHTSRQPRMMFYVRPNGEKGGQERKVNRHPPMNYEISIVQMAYTATGGYGIWDKVGEKGNCTRHERHGRIAKIKG